MRNLENVSPLHKSLVLEPANFGWQLEEVKAKRVGEYLETFFAFSRFSDGTIRSFTLSFHEDELQGDDFDKVVYTKYKDRFRYLMLCMHSPMWGGK